MYGCLFDIFISKRLAELSTLMKLSRPTVIQVDPRKVLGRSDCKKSTSLSILTPPPPPQYRQLSSFANVGTRICLKSHNLRIFIAIKAKKVAIRITS